MPNQPLSTETGEVHALPARLRPRAQQDVKTNALGKRRPVNLTELKADVRRFLRSTQRQPARVARYFHERHVTYAAAATI